MAPQWDSNKKATEDQRLFYWYCKKETVVSEVVKHIVIVGGGSAGWLAAGVIAAEHCSASTAGLQVTLLESPEIAPIGVGEGTWPTMRDTLQKIGVSEADFLRECDASFKQGSRFNGWVNGLVDDHYFHPFVLPQGYGETDLVSGWLQQHAGVPFADLVSFQPHLCLHGKAPKQPGTPEYAAVANYGYHLDAGKFGQFLRKRCPSFSQPDPLKYNGSSRIPPALMNRHIILRSCVALIIVCHWLRIFCGISQWY